ncbi:MAG: hypothetical protein ABW352_13015, partial [Polyangiales bacterium]
HAHAPAARLTPVGTVVDDDDTLEELSDSLPPLGAEEGAEEVGIDGVDEADIDEGPEEIGLDVETLDAGSDELDLPDDDEGSALDDDKLELDGDLDDDLDEDGWLDESEGAGAAWDDDSLVDEDDAPDEDDGGLDGVEDPSLDDFADEGASETTLSIEGEDLNAEEDLERVELDLG